MSNIPRSQGGQTAVVFTHQSAFNQIVEPGKFVSLTQYFIANWLPQISPNGLRILITLRSMGYFNAKSGEKRGEIDIEQDDLAALVGISEKTVRRAFADDAVLNKYVRRVFSVQRDRFGRIVKEHYVYVVTMDDVLTPEDQIRFERMVLVPDKGSKMGEDQAGKLPNGQSDRSVGQVDRLVGQLDRASGQVDPPNGQSVRSYKETPTLPTENTFPTPAACPEDSFSLSPGEEQTREEQSEGLDHLHENVMSPATALPASLRVRPWAQLTNTDREPWLVAAETELRENFGLAAWLKTTEKAKSTIRAQRAANLYLQSFDLEAKGDKPH